MVQSGNTDIQPPADLKGKVVAVKLGTATVEYVEKLGAKSDLSAAHGEGRLLQQGGPETWFAVFHRPPC